MNNYIVKITYKSGEIEERTLDQNGISELKQSILIGEDFYGKIPEKMDIVKEN